MSLKNREEKQSLAEVAFKSKNGRNYYVPQVACTVRMVKRIRTLKYRKEVEPTYIT
uniref:Ribosomal protein L33 n=1 Tax=Romanomermis culicivorax TaxID=13658 RepID=A0A915J831_ROMCU